MGKFEKKHESWRKGRAVFTALVMLNAVFVAAPLVGGKIENIAVASLVSGALCLIAATVVLFTAVVLIPYYYGTDTVSCIVVFAVWITCVVNIAAQVAGVQSSVSRMVTAAVCCIAAIFLAVKIAHEYSVLKKCDNRCDTCGKANKIGKAFYCPLTGKFVNTKTKL